MNGAAMTAVIVALTMLAVPASANHSAPIGVKPQVSTTTTTTVATTTTTTVSTTPTTTTAPVAPTSPAIIKPPTAILSGPSGQVSGDPGSWCWPQSNGQTLCLALARIGPPDPAASLPVMQGETITLRIETAVPVVGLRVGVWTGGPPNPPIEAPVANPSRFGINLAPGRHVIGVHATFQGMGVNAEYEFEVVVRPTGRLLDRTG